MDFAAQAFSTSQYSLRDRLPVWREFFTRKVVQLEVSLLSGDDAVALILKRNGQLTVSQCGREGPPGDGGAIGILHAEPADVLFSRADWL